MIREETDKDKLAIHAVNTSAFETAEEADLVDALRQQAKPVVSLVSVENEAVIGHIMFTPVRLTGHPDLNVMGLAPMAITPDYQRKGIGSELVTTGLQQCKELGVVAVVVLGHPEYYPQFGFAPSVEFDIETEYKVPKEVFMVKELQPGALEGISGTAKYHPAFGSPVERNLGTQPIATFMQNYKLLPRHLVSASKEQITHKMVARACKGRRLTPRVKVKIKNAMNAATKKEFSTKELFNY